MSEATPPIVNFNAFSGIYGNSQQVFTIPAPRKSGWGLILWGYADGAMPAAGTIDKYEMFRVTHHPQTDQLSLSTLELNTSAGRFSLNVRQPDLVSIGFGGDAKEEYPMKGILFAGVFLADE